MVRGGWKRRIKTPRKILSRFLFSILTGGCRGESWNTGGKYLDSELFALGVEEGR